MPFYNLVKSRFTLPFELYEFQQEVVNELAPHPRIGLWLDMGCVDADTEYLSPTGWVKMPDYAGGEVAQYNEDGTIAFVLPQRVINEPCDEMIQFKTSRGIDQVLTPDHRVLYKSSVSDALHVKTAGEIEALHKSVPQGFRGKFLTTFTPPDYEGLPMTDQELRVQVAVIADGHFPSGTANVVVNLKKTRKKDRLRKLLAEAGIQFTMKDRATSPGYTYFTFYAPVRIKEFDSRFYKCSRAQLKIIADESQHWDGSNIRSVMFFSRSKASADFVQYAMAASGTQATLAVSVRDGDTDYTVRAFSRTVYSSMNSTDAQKNVTRVKPVDGRKYCFTVPSSYLVLRRNGRIFITGNCGKTMVSTIIGLYKLIRGDIDKIIVLMPPILLVGWSRVLAKIPHVTHTIYRGTPTERAKLPLDKMFTLMSYQIFKKDKVRLEREFSGGRFAVICDESTAIKNVGSDTYQKVRDFVVGQDLMLLSGSPLSSPHDGYAPIKLISPSIYRTLSQYERIHVAERNFFGQVTKWQNLDLLSENLLVNSARVLKEDVLKDMPVVTYAPLVYELDKAHMKVYKTLCEQQMLKYDNGEKLDVTNASALFNALQQVPVNREHFMQVDGSSQSLDVIHEIMDELGDGKLVIFTSYRLTNRLLSEKLRKYGVVAVFGEVSRKQQDEALEKFTKDPSCRAILLQLRSAGFGLDGLQHVCSDVLFMEMPLVPAWFHQAVARLHRVGQTKPVSVRVAIAEGTIQERLWSILQDKDSLVNTCIRGPQDLRDALAGKTATSGASETLTQELAVCE